MGGLWRVVSFLCLGLSLFLLSLIYTRFVKGNDRPKPDGEPKAVGDHSSWPD